MSWTCMIGTALYLLALGCGVLSRRRSALCWLSGVLGVLSAGVLLYGGVSLAALAAGALLLALPLLLDAPGAGQEDA